jgi:hypothetical protein
MDGGLSRQASIHMAGRRHDYLPAAGPFLFGRRVFGTAAPARFFFGPAVPGNRFAARFFFRARGYPLGHAKPLRFPKPLATLCAVTRSSGPRA